MKAGLFYLILGVATSVPIQSFAKDSHKPSVAAFVMVNNPPELLNSITGLYFKNNLKAFYSRVDVVRPESYNTPEIKPYADALDNYRKQIDHKHGLNPTRDELQEQVFKLQAQWQKEIETASAATSETREKLDKAKEAYNEADSVRWTDEELKGEDLLYTQLQRKVRHAVVDPLERALKEHDAVDIFIGAHTNSYHEYLEYLPVELRKKIRLVYNSGCYDAKDARAWLLHGVGSYVGHPGTSFSPIFVRFFLKNWKSGDSLEQAVNNANRELEQTLTDPVQTCLSVMPLESFSENTFQMAIGSKSKAELFSQGCMLRLTEKLPKLISSLPEDLRCVLESPDFDKKQASKELDKMLSKIKKNDEKADLKTNKKAAVIIKESDSVIRQTGTKVLDETRASFFGADHVSVQSAKWTTRIPPLSVDEKADLARLKERAQALQNEIMELEKTPKESSYESADDEDGGVIQVDHIDYVTDELQEIQTSIRFYENNVPPPQKNVDEIEE